MVVSRETSDSRGTDSPGGKSASVSRETTSDPGPIPEVLLSRYPGAAEGLSRYAVALASKGVERGLIGPREVPRLWNRHLLNCAVVEELIPDGASVADVGSGAGLPGLVLALVRPDLNVTLIEPLLRRSVFLTEMLDELGLSNASVVRTRAEEFTDQQFEVVTSRAVAPLDRLARWCGPLIAPDGTMLALKGRSAAEELAEHAEAVRKTGLVEARIVQAGSDDADRTTVVVARKDPSFDGGPIGGRRAKRGRR